MVSAGDPDPSTIVETVHERATPDDAERAALAAVVERVVERAEAAVADLPVEARVVQVGSTARDTWLAGDRDVDIFVCFPPALDRATLADYGLQVGHEVLADGREEFAEHPYVVGEVDGFEIDLVPCYDVEAATDIRSAVDRTPFHSAYLADRVDETAAGEIRVCKQFLTGIGVYGSDLRTRGFSGYLTELLVLECGGFLALLETGADWVPPVRLDPAGHGATAFEDPLVVIDPTDPDRNVASVLTAENLARFQHYAREFRSAPAIDLFEPTEPEPLDAEAVRSAIARRGTTPVGVVFETPAIVDDQLWPQLRKSLAGVADALDRRGFAPLRTAAFAAERSLLLVELGVAELPAVERHDGPPVHLREHAERFAETYADRPDVYGPFLDGERYVIERDREHRTAAAVLTSDTLFDVSLGVHVEGALETDYDVLEGTELARTAEEFGAQWARYLDPTP